MKTDHKYKIMSELDREDVLKNYLVDSWSFSKVSEFSRNEKSFEMSSIYGVRQKSSSTTVAGSAYHAALDSYFKSKQDGTDLDIAALEVIAFEYIDAVYPNNWKVQKTTPTIEDCRDKATKTASALLINFFSELSVYMDDIAEILFVEMYLSEYLTINGVDIPLPCHMKIDLGIRTKSGKIAIVDHKSKNAFSEADEIKLSIGRQAITYLKGFEANTGLIVDEVWFIENKYSQNRSGAGQLNCFKVTIDADVRKLYEALLYEPLRKMLNATSDPDYVYVMNDADNYVDKAEMYDFWCKTMMAEVEEFTGVLPSKKDLVSKRLKKIRDSELVAAHPTIIKEFRRNVAEFIQYDLSNKNMTQSEKIEHVLRSFGVAVKVVHTCDGYSSNTYLLEVTAGQKIASIHSHKLDLANVLDVPSVRITKDLVMHQGKSYVAIETAKKRERDLVWDASELEGFKIPVGRDNFGRRIVWDLENHATPHVLVCGGTGSGKSVFIVSTVNYAIKAGIEDITILDPKYDKEFKSLSGAATIYNTIEDIETILELKVEEMNSLIKAGKTKKTLIIFDEFADAVMAARSGNDLNVYENVVVGYSVKDVPKIKKQVVKVKKSLEENLKIILQKGRSCGFRVITATQRASVKVITGDAKVNFPVQVCFKVAKEVDSKVVLDEGGAESLAGYGDGLIRSPEYPDVVRFQAYYKSN